MKYVQLLDGTITQDDLQKVEDFNQFFTSTFTRENPTSIPTLHIDKHVEPIDLPDISAELVFSKLCNLNSFKSPCPNGWSICP